jgi:glycosyltransferase involved in cell wall biosynthesis
MGWFPEQAGNGLDRMYHGLIQHLPAAGVDVTGLVAGSSSVASASNGVVRSFAPDTARLVRRLHHLRKAFRNVTASGPPDLVASHFAPYTAPVLDLLPDCPLIIHFHGPWGAESRAEGESALAAGIKTWIERAVYRRGTAFITLSAAFQKELVTEFGIDPDRIHVVPGGVNASAFDTGCGRTEARQRLGWPTDRPVVVAVRRLARRMGLERLIEAVRQVRQQIPDVLVLIAGTGPLRKELQARIDSYQLKRNVQLLGFVPERDLPYVYRAANLSIVPTVALEGFGLITVESLAAGTPVLVTPHGGLPEVVSGLDADLVLPGDDVEVLVEGLVRSLAGRVSLPASADCQRYVREHFDWTAIAHATRAVYGGVL